MLQRTLDGNTKFVEVAKAPMLAARDYPAFCNFNNVAIIVSGGRTSRKLFTEVERYDIARDTWTPMAPLNEGRVLHSSCTLGNRVYVFCGVRDIHEQNRITTVEVISTEQVGA